VAGRIVWDILVDASSLAISLPSAPNSNSFRLNISFFD